MLKKLLLSWNVHLSLAKWLESVFENPILISKQFKLVPYDNMNCWCVEKSSESQYHMLLRTTTCWQSSLRFASSFVIGCHILHLFKHLSTLENITTLSFPSICIISPLKAYFGYITKPFVTNNNIFIIGPCCCPCSLGKIVANYIWMMPLEYWLKRVRTRRPIVISLSNITLGDVSILWAALTFCGGLNLTRI